MSLNNPNLQIKAEALEKGQNERCAFEDGGWYRDSTNGEIEALWSITGACNHRCRHCFMSAPTAKFIEPSREQLLDVVSQLEDAGIRKVSLTGGEPLVSPYFFDIVEELKKRNITLSMIHTNGALVTEEFLDTLEEIGVRPGFQMSFDGIGWHDWLRGIPGSEKQTIYALRLLQQRGYRTGVTMVLHRHNMDVVNDTILLMKDLGVEHVKVHVATPAGLWVNEKEHFISQDDANQLLYDSIIPKFFADGAGIGVQFCMLLEYFPDGRECAIPAARFDGTVGCEEHFACAATRKNVYISPEGFVLSCMHLAGTAMQSVFENLRDKPLKEILTKSEYRFLVQLPMKEVLERNSDCQTCPCRLLCGGGCRACACGESGKNYLGVDQETCDFFRHGWYEKALELRREAKTLTQRETENAK